MVTTSLKHNNIQNTTEQCTNLSNTFVFDDERLQTTNELDDLIIVDECPMGVPRKEDEESFENFSESSKSFMDLVSEVEIEGVEQSDHEFVTEVVDILLNVNDWKECEKTNHIELSAKSIIRLCKLASPVFQKDGALARIGNSNEEYKVFGDIHGQYHDLIELISASADSSDSKSDTKYLFLGDYVDRGLNSLETVISLFAWKILAPNDIFLLRGNHEIAAVNRKYGFWAEILSLYNEDDAEDIFEAINETFNHLPFAAVLFNKYFCVHGGLSQQLGNVDDIAKIPLPLAVPDQGTMINDILWSDPCKKNQVDGFARNPRRGPIFGSNACSEFLQKNNLEGIIRAHQLAENGYWTACDDQVVTVFSAANYCQRNNKAAVLTCKETSMFICQYRRNEKGVLEVVEPAQ